MSTIGLPAPVLVARQIFRDVLNTSKCYSDFEPKDIDWTVNVWVKNFDLLSSNPETFYRTIVLTNRNSMLGKFALYFNRNLYETIKRRDEKLLVCVLSSPIFPEIEENPHLSQLESSRLQKELLNELTAVSLLMNKSTRVKIDLKEDPLMNTREHFRCRSEVCFNESGTEPKEIPAGSANPLCNVFVSEKPRNLVQVYCFNVLELVKILATSSINPYTEQKFEKSAEELLLKRYSIQIRLYVRFTELVAAEKTLK